MNIKDFKKILLIISILFFNLVSLCLAEKRLESKYFIVYFPEDIDLLSLVRKLDFPSEYLLGISFIDKPEIILTKILDAIFLETSDILGIHLESYKGNIRIYSNFEELNKSFKALFNQDLNTFSFYLSDSNTLYFDTENIKPEILAHEITHAIINRYFVISLPQKIQEILAKYVEYRIKKRSQLK